MYIRYAIRLASEPIRVPKPPAFVPHSRACQLPVRSAKSTAAGTLLIIWLERAEKRKIFPGCDKPDANASLIFSAVPKRNMNVQISRDPILSIHHTVQDSIKGATLPCSNNHPWYDLQIILRTTRDIKIIRRACFRIVNIRTIRRTHYGFAKPLMRQECLFDILASMLRIRITPSQISCLACIISIEILKSISRAKSLSLTVSRQLIVGSSNPNAFVVSNLSILCGVPARAAHPKGFLLFLL